MLQSHRFYTQNIYIGLLKPDKSMVSFKYIQNTLYKFVTCSTNGASCWNNGI